MINKPCSYVNISGLNKMHDANFACVRNVMWENSDSRKHDDSNPIARHSTRSK